MPAVPLALAAVADVGVLAWCRVVAAFGVVEPVTIDVIFLFLLLRYLYVGLCVRAVIGVGL